MKVSGKYPGVKLGFSTQNFQQCMPADVNNLKEIIDFAAAEGFEFIEVRDPLASLGREDCRSIASHAREKQIELLYEMHMDLFQPEFMETLERAVENTSIFGQPAILRSILSWSEFQEDPDKKGWTPEELAFIAGQAETAAEAARGKGVQLVLENIIEPWFGEGDVRGLADFFEATTLVGLQFDTANPFLPACRIPADPEKVAEYLDQLGERWVTTHLKSGANDQFQPVLTDNPLPYPTVFELMSRHQIPYAALELFGADDQATCFENHRKSLAYLASLDIVEQN